MHERCLANGLKSVLSRPGVSGRMRTTLAALLVLILTAACAGDGGVKLPPSAAYDGLVPGTIGIVVMDRFPCRARFMDVVRFQS